MDFREKRLLDNATWFGAENGVAPDAVISLKLRPQSVGGQAYYDGDVYEELRQELGWPNGDPTEVGFAHRLGTGLLVAERETGPEWFAAITTAGDVLSPFVTIKDFVVMVGAAVIYLSKGLNQPRRPSHLPTQISVEIRKITRNGRPKETTIVTVQTEVTDAKRLQKILETSIKEASR